MLRATRAWLLGQPLGYQKRTDIFFVVDLFKVRDAYKTYMKKVAKLLGGGPDSDEQMMKVFELERQLAVVSICWFS